MFLARVIYLLPQWIEVEWLLSAANKRGIFHGELFQELFLPEEVHASKVPGSVKRNRFDVLESSFAACHVMCRTKPAGVAHEVSTIGTPQILRVSQKGLLLAS